MDYIISPFNGQEIYSMNEYIVDNQLYRLKYVRWLHQLFEQGIMYSFYLN